MMRERSTGRLARIAAAALAVATALLASCAEGGADAPTGDDLARATILTENTEDGTATLDGGEFRAPVAPGSSAEMVIRLDKWTFGDLDGAGGADAAAITIEEPGGSGSFAYLHAFVNEEGELHDADTAFLGDRIRVEGVSIHDGVIVVAMLDRPADAPYVEAPSLPVIRRFRLAGESLEELESVGAEAGSSPAFACDGALPDAPLVVVTSPASGAQVASGFEVEGCSRTFEANVQRRLLDRTGEELASGFTTGGGIDGPAPFAFTVEFAPTERQAGHLEVFEGAASEGEGFPPPRDIVPLVLASE